MFGFLNVNKPTGPTSHDVVARIRRLLSPGTKVGHAGTLDPLAEGVLVVCVGPAVKLADYVQAQPKQYLARIALGATSPTDDREGEIRATPHPSWPDEPRVRQVLRGFTGEIQQTPPAYSAVLVDGQRAYKLARAGRQVPVRPRSVVIHAIDLIRYEPGALEIDVACGSGTYIRSLARDVGQALGVGGYLAGLTRTRVGSFRLQTAVTLEHLEPQKHLISPLVALEHLPRLSVDEEARKRIALGRAVEVRPRSALPPEGAETAVLDEAGNLIALARVDCGAIQPRKVFIGPG